MIYFSILFVYYSTQRVYAIIPPDKSQQFTTGRQYMPSLKPLTLYLLITLLLLSGCTQVVTAPISVAGSVVGATIDVADATVDAVTDSDDEDATVDTVTDSDDEEDED